MMSDELRPGPPGTPVPDGLIAIRLGRTAELSDDALRNLKEFARPHPSMFELSTTDKNGMPPHLSVWVERLTPATVAWHLSGSRPHLRAVIRLASEDVRSIPLPANCQPLDVAWFPAWLTPDLLDTRPGSEGHAGIINLEKPAKRIRKDLRDELCLRSSAEYLDDRALAAMAGNSPAV